LGKILIDQFHLHLIGAKNMANLGAKSLLLCDYFPPITVMSPTLEFPFAASSHIEDPQRVDQKKIG
jgi:hypothetical protein